MHPSWENCGLSVTSGKFLPNTQSFVRNGPGRYQVFSEHVVVEFWVIINLFHLSIHSVVKRGQIESTEV